MKRALLSVSDKTGIVELARALAERGIAILSTGGTARLLEEHGLAVTEVADYTGLPEMMGGRLKTLHPKIFGGILGRRGVDDEAMAEHGILPIDLVAVNLYPFGAMAEQGVGLPDIVEYIDIGGPALIRAAAKNFQAVTVAVDPQDYPLIIEALRERGEVDEATRLRLAVKAFAHTARYDGAIANHLGRLADDTPFPPGLTLAFRRLHPLRYGENPHQRAAFYSEVPPPPATVASARVLQGKALSYNNIADADAALACIKAFPSTACVIVKHANPCGVALGDTPKEAYERAYQADPTSAFGGIIAFNRPLDGEAARAILERQFVEVILAPEVSPEALEALAQKPNVRVLAAGPWEDASIPGMDLKRVAGGLLVQEWDLQETAELKTVTRRPPSEKEMADLLFAWKVVKFVKSNAIVYAKNGQTVGIGAGQPSRVMSARIAALKAAEAELEVRGAVMASDAFFPFRDGIDAAAQAGITAVIQPGGSVRDQEVIAAADEHGMAMVFTGMRHFRH